MEERFSYPRVAPGVLKAMMGLEEYVRDCGVEESLLHLIKLRASQINGCAYCIDPLPARCQEQACAAPEEREVNDVSILLGEFRIGRGWDGLDRRIGGVGHQCIS